MLALKFEFKRYSCKTTRCDLYIIANDKKEKIASGLLNPFIAHLKTAQDQIAEGGYSVLLQPESGSNATWFTKCTVERSVLFILGSLMFFALVILVKTY